MKYLSLFCGAGGFDWGFEKAGFVCELAIDNWDLALRAHKKNLSAKSLANADISKGFDVLPTVDVVIAGPPCQGFSTAGGGNANDARNELLIYCIHAALKANPKLIIIENVRGLLSSKNSSYLKRLKSILRQHKFFTRILELDASQHGVPQKRRRVFILASKRQCDQIEIAIDDQETVLDQSCFDQSQNTSQDAFKLSKDQLLIAKHIAPGQKLSDVRVGKNYVQSWSIPSVFGRTNYREKQCLSAISTLRRRHRVRDIGDGDPVSLENLETHLTFDPRKELLSLERKNFIRQPDKDSFELRRTFNGKYNRLKLGESSPTVVTQFGRPELYLHPTQMRGISLQEAARIQTFPESFEFEGTLRHRFQLIGNAVPPLLSNRIANAVRDYME